MDSSLNNQQRLICLKPQDTNNFRVLFNANAILGE